MLNIAILLSPSKMDEITPQSLQKHITYGLAQSDVTNPSVAVNEIRDKSWPNSIIGSSLFVSAEMEGEEVSFLYKQYHKRGVAVVRRSENISSERIVIMVPEDVHAGQRDTIYNGNIEFFTHPDDRQRRDLAEVLHAKTEEVADHINKTLDAPLGDPFNPSGETPNVKPAAAQPGVFGKVLQNLGNALKSKIAVDPRLDRRFVDDLRNAHIFAQKDESRQVLATVDDRNQGDTCTMDVRPILDRLPEDMIQQIAAAPGNDGFCIPSALRPIEKMLMVNPQDIVTLDTDEFTAYAEMRLGKEAALAPD